MRQPREMGVADVRAFLSMLVNARKVSASTLNPALRGQSVEVVPVMADSSCCIAASYEAKAFGAKTGTRVADAKRLCPSIALVLADHAKYVGVHLQAGAVVNRLTQVRQVVSIGRSEGVGKYWRA